MMTSSLSRLSTTFLRLNRKNFSKSVPAALDHGYLSGPLNLHTRQPLQVPDISEIPSQYGESSQALAGFVDYDEGIKNFQFKIPETFNFCRDVIDKWATVEQQELDEGVAEEGCLKHVGLWWASYSGQDYKWTYRQLSEISKRIAYVLTGPCALQHGDRLVVMMTFYPQYWLLYLACIRAGIIICPSSNLLTPDTIKSHIIASQAKCIITDHTEVNSVDQVAHECPDLKTKVFMPGSRAIHGILGWFNYADLYKTSNRMNSECFNSMSDESMIIFLTSGTTGAAKLVEHSHGSFGSASLINGKYFYDQTRDDVTWILADGGWAKLAWGILGAWHQGACVFGYCFKDPDAFHYEKFEPERILKMLEIYPITSLTTSPPLWRKLVQEDLPSYSRHCLRHAFSGGDLMNPEVIEKFNAGMGCNLYDGYGQTENSVLCAHFKCLPGKEGSLGKPAPGYQLAIINNEGEELSNHCDGHIAVKVEPKRPPGLFLGYLNNPHKTAECYVGDYYITGDVGHRDDDGYYWFSTRKVDLIYTDGLEVCPFDVENAMMEHQSVAACAVVSSPDHLQLTGQVVKAFIVLSDDYKADTEQVLTDLQQHAVSMLKSHEVPQQIEFIDDLPTTASGKLRRSELREREWSFHN